MNTFDTLRAQYLDQPYEVSIETLALCNARCSFCPYPTLQRKGARLGTEIVMGLIAQMSHFTQPFFFSPFKVNEPLLDSRLFGFCNHFINVCEHGRLRLFTNGQPLTPEKVIEINSLDRVEHLWISLNSHDPVEYRQLMGLDLRLTLMKLDMLHRMIVNGMFRHSVVVSKVSASPRDEQAFCAFCAERWPFFRVHLIKQDGWLGYVPPSDPRIPDAPCARWFELSITATGAASLCCMDGKAEFAIGDVRAQTLLEIYNASAFRERREQLLSRKGIHPCATCTY